MNWKRWPSAKCGILELRYFLGCTNEEAAQVLGVSRPTIVATWSSPKRGVPAAGGPLAGETLRA